MHAWYGRGVGFTPLARPRPGASPRSTRLIASGGISSLEDLHDLATLGVEGAIVGKALYTGDVDLATAIREIER
jgi:phosphoribosylformimino-5-aminoimidazole carboxamide ribonucleotide (ProFAR) isomerase